MDKLQLMSLCLTISLLAFAWEHILYVKIVKQNCQLKEENAKLMTEVLAMQNNFDTDPVK